MNGKRNGPGKPPGPAAPFVSRPSPQAHQTDLVLRRMGFDGQRVGTAPAIQTSSFTGSPAQSPRPNRTAETALARRDWLLSVMERQRSLSTAASALIRCEGITAEQFLEHFYAPSRPCVIAGALADWPALQLWTPEYLRDTVGDAPVEFQGRREAAGDFELAKDRHKQTLPFSAYLDLIEANPGNDAYVTAYNSSANRAAFAPLMRDVRPLPNLLGPGEGMLWVGPAGTFTPLHFDLTNNLLIQITGRKRVLLVPPSQTRLLSHHRHVFSDVHDLEDEACMKRHPLAQQVQPYVVTLEAGDMLFIPVGWWHQVRSLDFSVMMTCINFLWPNNAWQDYPADS
ncbi:MAG: cupin-like domain-containing protein [Alphaproteobacteria bacterium]|nr:cupin-like domain-containing protein [Alphaproteobacteria bacterium]MBU0874484.1 cupin-like domain-containing protein [Alphaproteobacteria bacterium]MBU1769113.1 cupin-like domain-containing protein [Alphaproteobacteria bacterium]